MVVERDHGRRWRPFSGKGEGGAERGYGKRGGGKGWSPELFCLQVQGGEVQEEKRLGCS
jgi:hypothetical protein